MVLMGIAQWCLDLTFLLYKRSQSVSVSKHRVKSHAQIKRHRERKRKKNYWKSKTALSVTIKFESTFAQ